MVMGGQTSGAAQLAATASTSETSLSLVKTTRAWARRLADRITLCNGAQLIHARRGRPRYRKGPIPAAHAERQLVVVQRLPTGEVELLVSGVHLPYGDSGAQFNAVRGMPIDWLDTPAAEVFLSAQVRFGERWSTKGDARL